MVWNRYDVILKPLFLAGSQYGSNANRPISHGDIHLAICTFILLPSMEPASPVDHFLAIALQHNYVLLVGWPLTDFPHAAWFIPLHPIPSQPLILGQRIYLPASLLGHILVKSSLSSGLKNPIWSSLCHLNPLPMAHSLLSHVKSTSSHHSSFFPHCIICSTQCLHLISLMPFWNNTMLLTLPWSTHKEHMPCPNSPRDWHFKGNPSSPCLWPIAATLHLWHKMYWSPTITPGTPGHLFLMHTHFYHTSSPWWSHPDSP